MKSPAIAFLFAALGATLHRLRRKFKGNRQKAAGSWQRAAVIAACEINRLRQSFTLNPL
jgi:hypothetical protein